MLNLFTKTKPWMVVSLVAATSVFGKNNSQQSCPPKNCPQPTPPTQTCPSDACCPAWPTPVLNAAYNYPARVQTRCPWDIFFDASFVYWQPVLDNIELGIGNATSSPVTNVNGDFINMDFDFKPGFKVGLGGNFDHDNWDVRFGYTWFHTTNSKSAVAPTNGVIIPSQGTPARQTGTFASASENWDLRMDILDFDLGRWYYVGTKLVFHPVVGVRADWIRQHLKTNYTSTSDRAVVTQNSRSWALGPKIGLDTNWNVGMGFRFFGNSEADLLFTDYTDSSFSETHTLTTHPFQTKQSNIYAVRPHFDLDLGLGWGTALDCNNWYMDFTVGYEFQVFFDQNMFRHFTDDQMVANSNMPNGNLYLQGLTASFKLDF